MSNERVRNFFIRTYATLPQIISILESKDVHCCDFAFHNADGCVVHAHLVLCFIEPKSLSQVESFFAHLVDSKGLHINTEVEICKDLDYCRQYLTHMNCPDKHPYSIEDVFHFGTSDPYYKSIRKVSNHYDSTTLALFELLDSEVSLRDLAYRYGRDFILHYSAISELVKQIRYEDNHKKQ